MSAIQNSWRREAWSFLSSWIGAVAEIVVDTTNWRAVVQDGATAGGFPLAKLAEVVLNSQADALTAHAGGGQASALLLTATINRITTVASAADSVKLSPSSATNGLQVVINDGANAAQLYGSGADTINGAAAGTGISLAAGKIGIYFSSVAGIWRGGVLS